MRCIKPHRLPVRHHHPRNTKMRLTFIVATTIGVAVLNYVHCASITTMTEPASVERGGVLEPRISASNPALDILDKNSDRFGQGGLLVGQDDLQKRTNSEHAQITNDVVKTGTSLAAGAIAAIVIVPLIALIAIIVVVVFVCKACARR